MDNIEINAHRRKFLGTTAIAMGGVVVAGSGLLASVPAAAQATAPSGLAVIGHPDIKGVVVERVSYPNRNTQTQIAANLFKPANFDPAKKYPAIVVTHPIGGVKEQTSGLYALRLAEQGFITLAYDASYQGDSGGLPRLMELPTARVDDISSSIDFLSTHPQVDANRIGSLGICGGGGYVVNAAQTELRIRAVATVSAADIGDLRRSGLANNRSYEERMKLLQDAVAQRSREARGEPIRLVPTVPESTKDFTASTPVMYREGYEYYKTARGQHPNAPTRAVFSSLPAQMAFFAFDQIETIAPRPILMIAGANADSLYTSENAIKKANEPKELFLVPGATHIDMYDKPQYVTPAVEKLDAFFRRTLA
ncbi:alpha/beta hydrolase [Hydrogenophaga palleronii]|uniref:alpha/beta hydrolase n=1 Tax=Hydrogenophaga palleronii TaxID=65655 RepID=UPI0008256BED|nr:alpha/beta hydrolase [Hydrogenophaga palleronii]